MAQRGRRGGGVSGGQEAADAARAELIRRVLDPDGIREIAPMTLVRVAQFLGGGGPRGRDDRPADDHVALVRRLGVPPDRQVELLARLAGVTSEEAATLLADGDE